MCGMRKNSYKRGNKSSTFIYKNNISENKTKIRQKIEPIILLYFRTKELLCRIKRKIDFIIFLDSHLLN